VTPPKSAGKRTYDVAVLGPDVGGAAAAALIAKRGLRVLLAPMGPPLVARESEGFLLPAAHPVLPPLHKLSGAAGALDELGLAQELVRQAAGTQGALQLLGEKLRLSLPGDPARRRAELHRELPDVQAQEAEAALDSLERLGRPWDPFLLEPPPLPAHGFFERRKLRKILPVPSDLPGGLVGECLLALAPFAAGLSGDSAPEATAREAAALFRAPLRLWGGAAGLAEMLRKKAQEAGAEILPDRVSALRLERKGASFQLGDSEVHASTIVLACGSAALAELFAGGGRVERKLAEESAMTVVRKIVLGHFVVRAEGLPLALEEASLLLGHVGGPLVISSLPARRVRGDASDERVLTVGRVVESSFSDGAGLLAQFRAALEPVLPFFERHLLHQSADLDPQGAAPIFKPADDLEPIGLRPLSDAHERILFASAAVYPGFGLEGAILGAKAAATQALLLSGRKSVSAT